MEIPVLVRTLKSSILSSTSFQMGKTFWGVGSAAVEQFRSKSNMVAQGDGKFGPRGWPQNPSKVSDVVSPHGQWTAGSATGPPGAPVPTPRGMGAALAPRPAPGLASAPLHHPPGNPVPRVPSPATPRPATQPLASARHALVRFKSQQSQ